MDQHEKKINYKMDEMKELNSKIACAASQSPRGAGVLGTESLTQVVDLKQDNGDNFKGNDRYLIML